MKLDRLINDFNLPTLEYHHELNPSIWQDGEIKPEVRLHLLSTAKAFYDFCNVAFPVMDVILTGSNANFNYTIQSDLDVHLVTDMTKVNTGCETLASELFMTKKSLWAKEHKVVIKGQPVELYVEDKNNPAKAGGVYSLLQGKWLRHPVWKPQHTNELSVLTRYRQISGAISSVLAQPGSRKAAESLMDQLYQDRQRGLAQGGEFAPENLVFKIVRNTGLLDSLKQYIKNEEDSELSLESQNSLE